MPDCSVYMKVINNTDFGYVLIGSTEPGSQWINLPSEIPPKQTVQFQLKDTTWYEGSEGTLVYNAIDINHNYLDTRITLDVADPYSVINDNKVDLDVAPKSPDIVAGSFRASVEDDQHYEKNKVESRGHPVYAEFTFDYGGALKKLHKFNLVKITAESAHPVRNADKHLITGTQTLWDSADTSKYKDKDGSLAPNAYKYVFDSEDTGILNVTVRPLDDDLKGLQAYLTGTVGNEIVFKSDDFTFKSASEDVVVTARVVKPKTSSQPFSINADVDWGAKLVVTDKALGREPEGLKGITRLELYWIAETLHPAFADDGLPVAFLRQYVPPTKASTQANPKADVLAIQNQWFQEQVAQIFYNDHKRYDVVSGRSYSVTHTSSKGLKFFLRPPGAAHFDVGHWGGVFAIDRYLAGNCQTNPVVNCMDLAAAVQLACSMMTGAVTVSWLYLQPFGFIDPTKLIGIVDDHNNPIDVNNPFYDHNNTTPLINPTSDDRTSFGCHVFTGNSANWKHESDDGIYDACAGPHIGNENIREYITFAIDNNENQRRWGLTVDYRQVLIGYGVYQINRQPTYPPGHDMAMVIPESNLVSQLVSAGVAQSTHPLGHVGWDNLPTWLGSTLGDAWAVQYEEISVGKPGVAAFWQTSDGSSSICIRLHVFSVIASDGTLDVEGSAAAARQHVSGLLMSTQRSDAWSVGNLSGYGAALQYADHIPAGRTAYVAGNVVMDISGMPSTEALLPTTLKLLNQTARRDPANNPLVVPVLQRQSIHVDSGDNGALVHALEDGTITVTGVYTHFSVVFTFSSKIATANAGSNGGGVLFDRYTAKEVDDGKGSTVEFLFISHKLGRHPVRVCMAEAHTLISTSFDLVVEVVQVDA